MEFFDCRTMRFQWNPSFSWFMTIIKLFHVQFHLINFQYFAPDMPFYALCSHCDYHFVLFFSFDDFNLSLLLFKFIKCKHFIDFVCYALLRLVRSITKNTISNFKMEIKWFCVHSVARVQKSEYRLNVKKNWAKKSLRVWKLGRQEELVEKKPER